jgi:hypothetical protein
MRDDDFSPVRLGSGFRPPQPPPDEPEKPHRGETWPSFYERWRSWRREMERYNAIRLRRNHYPQDSIPIDDPARAHHLEKMLSRLK